MNDYYCPYCEKHFNRHTGLTGSDDPEVGDVSMCIACGSFSMFTMKNGEYGLRRPTKKESKEIAADKDCQRLHRIWEETEDIRPASIRRH